MNKSLTAMLVAVALLTVSGGAASAGLTMETPEDDEDAISSMLDQQLRNLDLAQALQAETGSDASSQIGKAILATGWQVATLGLDEVPPVSLVGYEEPSEALLELASRHGVELTPGEREDLRSLDDLNEPVRAALARTLDAFLALESAAGLAYANADFDGLREITYDASFDDEGIALAGVDLAPVLSTRSQFLDAVDELQSVLANGMPLSAAACSPVQVAPAFSIDLDVCDNTYTADFALLIDAGGSDTYHNNAGGGNGFWLGDPCYLIGFCIATAALVDLGSDDDAYGDPVAPRGFGANGGAYLGEGFLYDAGGDDTYTAGDRGVNGGGYNNGAGFLLDVDGNDTYTAGDRGTNGGGTNQVGVGFLYDGAGDDAYTAGDWATNGGGVFGVGFLYDGTGDDTYTAGDFGTNGGANAGAGFLSDGAGNDTYTVGRYAANGGAVTGVGFLYDGTGDDTYTAGDYGTNGEGISEGVGLLFDGGGTDEYEDALVTCTDCSMIPKGTGAQVDEEL